MSKTPNLTRLQIHALMRGIAAAEKDTWIRALSSGDRVTLASLHTRGLLERRAWRGAEGEANAAHEYRATAVVLESWREMVAKRRAEKERAS